MRVDYEFINKISFILKEKEEIKAQAIKISEFLNFLRTF